uniref:Small ribosomal subunit protein uS10m n=1 Tax=Ochromonas danica TaxID=2986 RepID=Q9G907_OCHDN|nr:ribosomal protein S10 [Ochromonas danica]AAG18398.1 ribosomal protein S10 [Ochromonas danica]
MKKIIVKSNNKNLLECYVRYLKTVIKIKEISIVWLPKTIKKITLLKSPHVYKKTKAQYQKVTFKCLIEIKKDIFYSKLIFILRNIPKSIAFKIYS